MIIKSCLFTEIASEYVKTGRAKMAATLTAFLLLASSNVDAKTLTVNSTLDNGDAGTLRAQIANATSGDKINFAVSSVALENGQISIDKDLTIKGNVTISGESISRIFVIQPGIHVSLKDLTVINGKTDDAGGAVYIDGSTLDINNCTFENNISDDDRGGALYNNAGTLSVKNSYFRNNSADRTGGAISTLNGAVDIKESIFKANSADDHGGAIHSQGSNLEIKNTAFKKNIATGSNWGGAIYFRDGQFEIADSTFIKNSAGRQGGAINFYAGAGKIKGSTFKKNSSNSVNVDSPGRGGAIYVYFGANLAVKNSVFDSNAADPDFSSGGAIFVYDDGVFAGALTNKNNTFTNNTPDGVAFGE